MTVNQNASSAMRNAISWATGAALVVATVLAGGAAPARGAPAQDAPAQGAAAADELILGRHQNLGGTTWRFTANDANTSDRGSDEASSLRNVSTTVAWVVYEHYDYQGRGYCVDAGETVPDLHLSILGFGDRISSVRKIDRGECFNYPQFYGSVGVPAPVNDVLIVGQNQRLGGTRWTFRFGDADIEGYGGDSASSLKNDSHDAWVVYEHDTFRGRGYCLRAGSEVSDLHLSILGFGDRISSVQRLTTPDCHQFPAFPM